MGVRLPLAAVTLLAASGISLLLAARPNGHQVDSAAWIVVAIGASIAVDVILGLLLYVMSVKITATSMTLACLVFVALFAGMAAWRSTRHEAGRSLVLTRPSAAAAAVVLLTIDAAALATVVSSQAAATHRYPGYTKFALDPADSGPQIWALTIGNHEGTTTRYRLAWRTGEARSAAPGRTAARGRATATRRGTTLRSSTFRLSDGQTVRKFFSLPRNGGCVWVALYRVTVRTERIGNLCVDSSTGR
jgi:hypothetical protein